MEAMSLPVPDAQEYRVQQALLLLELDPSLAIFPLVPGDKVPLTKNGFKDAVRDPDSVAKFIRNPGKVNYGVCIKGPSDLFLLDVDGGNGLGESWHDQFDSLKRELGPFPSTWGQKTPSGGWHLIGRFPPGAPMPPGNKLWGWTARMADTGYIVGPGSVVNGTMYTRFGPDSIATVPDSWVQAAQAGTKRAKGGLIVIGKGSTYDLPASVGEGDRYNAIRDYVASRYNYALSPEEMWAGVRDVLARRFTVPLSEQELRERFDRATKDLAERFGPPAIPASKRTKASKSVHTRQMEALDASAPYSIKPFSAYAPREMEWLWPGWLPRGVVTLLDGNPGVGKSNIVVDLVSRMTHGQAWPDGSPGDGIPRKTLYITREDDPSTTLGPRLLAAGGDPNFAYFLDAEFVLPDDALRLDDLIARAEPDLVFIDPIFSHVSAEVQTISDNDARVNVMNPLMEIAGRHGCSILVARHFNKSVGSSALNRGAGSLGGFVGAARQVLGTAHDPEDEEGHMRVFGIVKSSYAPENKALRYQIVGHLLEGWARTVSRVSWEGPSLLTIDDILSGPDPAQTRGAADALRDILDGSVGVTPAQAIARMRAAGFGKSATYVAAKRIGVAVARMGFPAESRWYLPAPGVVGVTDVAGRGGKETGFVRVERPPSERVPEGDEDRDAPVISVSSETPYNRITGRLEEEDSPLQDPTVIPVIQLSRGLTEPGKQGLDEEPDEDEPLAVTEITGDTGYVGIRCFFYTDHQSSHVFRGGNWVCLICSEVSELGSQDEGVPE